ncbi:MAG: lysophospholipid acyltransferase family protein [Porphyromonas sp.]|nr:lysophospholipid acyltransferase family protein [Porphyromonas sp.]
MKRLFYLVYLTLIALPLFAIVTILCAIFAGIGSAFINERIFSYYPGRIWSRIALALFLCPIEVRGKENIPKGKSTIVISNHQSSLDIYMLYGYMGIPFKWVLKGALRKVPFVGWACEKSGFIFVDNSSPRAAALTVKQAEEAIRNGYSIFIFPEGSRTDNGELQRFKRGAFKIAQDTQATILPVAIKGAYESLPKNAIFVKPRKLILEIGLPFESSVFEQSPHGLIELTQRGENEVRTLIEKSV